MVVVSLPLKASVGIVLREERGMKEEGMAAV